MTPQKLEILKMQLLDEVERTYHDKFQKQEQELSETHSELTKVRYELSFLKAEYEHVNVEHQRVIEEITLQHNAEVIIFQFTLILIRQINVQLYYHLLLEIYGIQV